MVLQIADMTIIHPAFIFMHRRINLVFKNKSQAINLPKIFASDVKDKENKKCQWIKLNFLAINKLLPV